MKGVLHRQTAQPNNQRFIGFVEVMRCKAKVEFIRKSQESCTEINGLYHAPSWIVLGFINETPSWVNHVPKRKSSPVQRFLHVGHLHRCFDGQFPRDGLLVAVNAAGSRRAEGSASRLVIHHDEAQSTRKCFHILIVGCRRSYK